MSTTTQTRKPAAKKTTAKAPAKKAAPAKPANGKPAAQAPAKKAEPAKKAAPVKPAKPQADAAVAAKIRERALAARQLGFNRPALRKIDPSVSESQWYAAWHSDKKGQRLYQASVDAISAVLDKIEAGEVTPPARSAFGASAGPSKKALLEVIESGRDADDEQRAVLFGQLVDMLTPIDLTR